MLFDLSTEAHTIMMSNAERHRVITRLAFQDIDWRFFFGGGVILQYADNTILLLEDSLQNDKNCACLNKC